MSVVTTEDNPLKSIFGEYPPEALPDIWQILFGKSDKKPSSAKPTPPSPSAPKK